MSFLSGCFAEKASVAYNGNKDLFKSAKDSYPIGYEVILTFTDDSRPDYEFFMNIEKLDAKYEEGKGYTMSFEMPKEGASIKVAAPYKDPTTGEEKLVSVSKNPSLSFHSFDGGGAEYSAKIDDTDILKYTYEKVYSKANHEELEGAGYDVYYTLEGLKPGRTQLTISAESPLYEEADAVYDVIVHDNLMISITKIDIPDANYDEPVDEPVE